MKTVNKNKKQLNNIYSRPIKSTYHLKSAILRHLCTIEQQNTFLTNSNWKQKDIWTNFLHFIFMFIKNISSKF